MAHPLGTGIGSRLSRAAEEDLLALLRPRVEAFAARRRGTTLVWERTGRSAELDDLRARAGLDRAAADQLPCGSPWRARARRGWLFPRAEWGISMGLAVSWGALARGEDGTITVADAWAYFERERAAWRRRFGRRPFYGLVAGAFAGPLKASPHENLALLAWKNGAWRFYGREDKPELADLFFPRAAEKSGPVPRSTGMSTFSERLLSPFRGKLRAAEARLAARTQEFTVARRNARHLQSEYELHAAATDWSSEMLQVQQGKVTHALRTASLLHRQVQQLQENLQLLTTARQGGALIADSAPPVDGEELESLDRSYHEMRSRRQEVTRAERILSDSLLGDEPAITEAPMPEAPAEKRLLE
ncbi:MAG TPA: hypothetical protein VGL42_06850 [Opitutaceae bacterium]|jgi:hypothetical protein